MIVSVQVNVSLKNERRNGSNRQRFVSIDTSARFLPSFLLSNKLFALLEFQIIQGINTIYW